LPSPLLHSSSTFTNSHFYCYIRRIALKDLTYITIYDLLQRDIG
jgi:hypothetical protein